MHLVLATVKTVLKQIIKKVIEKIKCKSTGDSRSQIYFLIYIDILRKEWIKINTIFIPKDKLVF
jgi:hypothetical protein